MGHDMGHKSGSRLLFVCVHMRMEYISVWFLCFA